MRLLFAVGLAACARSALAADTIAPQPVDPDPLTVWGKRQEGIGRATSASEGLVSFGAFADRPILRPGELVEVTPGMAATQHSGSGKANQYFLRGFNLDHGTDFSASLDGVPLNLRTNAHGQGYLDLNLLTPELVDTIRYRKGPYFADAGDFSAAGTVALESFRRAPESFLEGQAGGGGYARLVGAADLGDGLVAVDLTRSDGPWVNSEGLRKGSALLRQGFGGWSLTALAYGARWNATDQVPLRAVEDGRVPRLGAVDPTDGGRTSRFIVSLRRHPDEGSDTVVYVQDYRLKLWSDFTYFLDDPVHGDQFEQAEHRWIFGGSALRTWRPRDNLAVRFGGDARVDDITSIGLYHTAARQVLSTMREDAVAEWSGAAFAEAQWRSGPVRVSLGLRGERYGVHVDAGDPRNGGEAGQGLVSPKATVAWRVADGLELYVDAGRGFHSNDARGATEMVAPGEGTPVVATPLLAPGWGGEVGARLKRGPLAVSAALWGLKLSSELVYSGDAGDTESNGATTRYGLEVLASWTPADWLNLDASLAATHARYDDAPGADRIPNALEHVVTGGASVRLSPDLHAELTLRHLGPAPLVEGNRVRAPSSTLANLGLNYRTGRALLGLDVLNLFDSRSNDITYFYASRLPGEPAGGVDDLHIHPVEPRQVRATVRWGF